MRILIKDAVVVNEGKKTNASLIIEDDRIADIIENDNTPRGDFDETVDAAGCFVLPGVIDSHVHFREPGLTAKADIESESRAAAYGGVTSYFDMPNTKPQTTTLKDLGDKMTLAGEKSHVNYAFFIGATNDNIREITKVDPKAVPGVKLFMGSSTGNMLVDKRDALQRIFSEVKLPIMAHCENTEMINRNMQKAKERYGDDPDVRHHPEIRSEDACWLSSSLAVEMARNNGAHLHVAHLTTKRELGLFEPAADGNMPAVTAEATVAHLLFCDEDYASLGARIKCNPAIKTAADRNALRQALSNGRIFTIGTDHAPHCMEEKQGGCAKAMSGMPMIQFSLVSMLGLVDEGIITIERLAELMCHNPATLFSVEGRGFIRKGYKADIAIVRRGQPWQLTADKIQSKCKWSPLEGRCFNWRVEHTFCNGRHIYNKGVFDNSCRGEKITFNR